MTKTLVDWQIEIGAWGDRSFGQTPASVWAHLRKEIAELWNEPDALKRREECADVLSLMLNLAHTGGWVLADVEPSIEIVGTLTAALPLGLRDQLWHLVNAGGEDTLNRRIRCANVLLVMQRLAEAEGWSLDEELARKFAINQGRTWVPNGEGFHEHVR